VSGSTVASGLTVVSGHTGMARVTECGGIVPGGPAGGRSGLATRLARHVLRAVSGPRSPAGASDRSAASSSGGASSSVRASDSGDASSSADASGRRAVSGCGASGHRSGLTSLTALTALTVANVPASAIGCAATGRLPAVLAATVP